MLPVKSFTVLPQLSQTRVFNPTNVAGPLSEALIIIIDYNKYTTVGKK